MVVLTYYFKKADKGSDKESKISWFGPCNLLAKISSLTSLKNAEITGKTQMVPFPSVSENVLKLQM